MANKLKKIVGRFVGQNGVLAAKKLFYGERGEPISYGPHHLSYLPGTRPLRLEYINSEDVTVRNDAKQLKFFLDNISKNDFVLDIGGHYGQYAVLFGVMVGDGGRVITFEPDQAARKVLSKNLALNKLSDKVKIEEIALSDTTGVQSFFSMGGNSMSSLARSGLGGNAFAEGVSEEKVSTMTLDEYLSSNNLGFPKWIKLDTEGAEISILKGARQVLKSGANIMCELHPYAWEEFETNFGELLQVISECGRKIRYLDESLKIEDGAVYGAAIIS